MNKNTAAQNLKAAKEQLAKVAEADKKAGRHYETDAYLKANARVVEAEKHVSWWRR
ncbi:hypothetical protein AB0I72_23385 [Nocardiopsis sp. NPDC049922]|uniref:hypothetical protein n=1 Tax=Nocardiopsis sp. NPDC049922 TaxID=3155157 RepID=UPI0033C10A6C